MAEGANKPHRRNGEAHEIQDSNKPASAGEAREPQWWHLIKIPHKTTPLSNRAHQHWRKIHRIAQVDREVMRLCWMHAGRPVPPRWPCVIIFRRLSPGVLDSDNLPTCFKAMRDELAELIGLGNDAGPEVEWRYEQTRVRRGQPITCEVEMFL